MTNIHLVIDRNGKDTFATVILPIDGKVHSGHGSAFTHPNDEYNEALGAKMATIRALTKLAVKLQESVNEDLEYAEKRKAWLKEKHAKTQALANARKKARSQAFTLEFAKLIEELNPGIFGDTQFPLWFSVDKPSWNNDTGSKTIIY